MHIGGLRATSYIPNSNYTQKPLTNNITSFQSPTQPTQANSPYKLQDLSAIFLREYDISDNEEKKKEALQNFLTKITSIDENIFNLIYAKISKEPKVTYLNSPNMH